ncbi:MAG: hypothetical protein ACRD6X_03315 [Pyrinomonadaceae bacterium]
MSKFPLIIAIGLVSMWVSCSHAQRTEVTVSQPSPPSVATSPQATPDDFPSDEQFEKWQEDSFRPVINKWLKGEHVPQYVELDRKDEYASNSERGARLELIDVNRDGRNELAMQTACATVGNCVFLLFQQTTGGYRQLLAADMVQRFKLRRARSNKYFDLETSSHGSATEGGIAIYKYDGTEYKIAECFGYEYERTGKIINGQAITRDKPTLTPADCKDWPATDNPPSDH